MTLPSRVDLIFNPILLKVFPQKQFSAETFKIIETIATATIKLWSKVKNTLLPTPAKFHYVFNLRDVSRIFKGMCQVTSKTILDCSSIGKAEIKPEVFMIALWKHECERVFVDKLIFNKDKEQIINFINESCLENFSQYESEILEKLSTKTLYFCDFLTPDVVDDDGVVIDEAPKIYEAIWDIPALRKRCQEL
jgi:dynein heavy chain